MIKYKYTDTALKLMENNPTISFEPRRADNGSSGYDLSACIPEAITLWQDQVIKIPTGVHIWIGNNLLPEKIDTDYLYHLNSKDFIFAGLYLPRSSSPGLKLENTVGLLDSSYQGESFLKYKNTSDHCITINPGDRIGQLVIIPTYVGCIELAQNEWECTERIGGFGSTGI